MGFLILEGPDLSGKTTLISKLEKNNIGKSLNKFKLTENDWKDHISMIGKISYYLLRNFQSHNYLIDRLAISDFVYDKVYQRNNDKSFINLKKDFYDSKVVYITVSKFDILAARYNNNSDYITLEKLEEIYDEYERFFSVFNELPVLKVINDKFNIDLNLIKQFWNSDVYS